MSDYEFDDDMNDGPKALRDAYDKLKKQLADEQKAKAALEAERDTLRGQVKKSSLAELLVKHGIDAKFAARADRDGAEATEEGVKAWIDENRDFYNFNASKPEEPAGDGEPDGEPTIPDGMEEGVRAGQALDASGVAPSEVQITQKLQSIDPKNYKNSEEFLAALAATGVQFD